MRYSELKHDPWAAVCHWVWQWGGHERDVYLLDIAEARVLGLVGRIERWSTDIEVHPAEPTDAAHPLTSARDAVKRYLNGLGEGNVGIVGRVRGLPLQIYLARCEEGSYDLDIVFWADRIFGEDETTEARRRKFEQLVQLALDLGEAAHPSRIVLVDGGDPRDCAPGSSVVIWDQSD